MEASIALRPQSSTLTSSSHRPLLSLPQLTHKRPLSPDVLEIDNKSMHYKFPWGAITSIMNRATGVSLSVGEYLNRAAATDGVRSLSACAAAESEFAAAGSRGLLTVLHHKHAEVLSGSPYCILYSCQKDT